MTRARFALTSDQLELLLAFGSSRGLTALADTMAKDPSVISRGLQRLAEDAPVLAKVSGRWELTTLGLELNELTAGFLREQARLLTAKPEPVRSFAFSKSSALVVINAQQGLLDSTQPGRNNSEAEIHIARLLAHWRAEGRPVFHVRHVSERAASPFYRQGSGFDFLPQAQPAAGEVVIEKQRSSAFHETDLGQRLTEAGVNDLVLVGFTANDCIDATARDSAAAEFSTFVVGDATAMFDLEDANGKWLKAERVHRLTLANLNAFSARVIQTADVLGG